MKINTDQNGRIYKANGRAWTHQWRAEYALEKLGLTETHVVDGHGNEGLGGRAYFVRPKFANFLQVSLEDHKDYYPINSDLTWVFEISDEEEPDRVDHFIWELKMYGKDWNLTYDKDRKSIGFNRHEDYLSFKRALDSRV